ncbi:MAG: hypothetical protein EHM72_16795, partial [Calditrichaeota bacterium]
NPEGQYILKDEFIPPSVYCSSSTRLAILLTNILEMLVGKSSSLWHSRKLPSSGDRTFTPNDAFNLGILKVLHHYLPLLRHAQSALMHPESLYLLLCSLIGELYTYSALGENLFDQIPSYDHQKLTQTFNPLEKTIRLLIQGVGATRNYISIPLKKVENTLYHGEIKETYDFQLWNVYLMVVSNLPDTELIHQVTNIVKIASIDELHNLEEFALRGVEAVFASRVPFGLPASKENSYFQLNTSGFLWKKIIESKTIAMRIPQNLTEAKFELALIKKE